MVRQAHHERKFSLPRILSLVEGRIPPRIRGEIRVLPDEPAAESMIVLHETEKRHKIIGRAGRDGRAGKERRSTHLQY